MRSRLTHWAAVLTVAAVTSLTHADTQQSGEIPMLTPTAGFSATSLFTVGEAVGAYRPPGILDGLGAYVHDANTIRVLANHELSDDDGYAYALRNGTQLTGARISYFDIDRRTRQICAAGLAYGRVYDRSGKEVTAATQINEASQTGDGLARFCSGRLVNAGERGFVDTVYFAGEEVSDSSHAHGGGEWALDVANGDLWACPELGRAKWENVAPLDAGSSKHVALLMCDDTAGAPLFLWVGKKSKKGNFLQRNGLAKGKLYAWIADGSARDAGDFNGTGATLAGSFVRVKARNPRQARRGGYDNRGYLDTSTLRREVAKLRAFEFARPEDVHDNPFDGTQAVFATTGSSDYPDDRWGQVIRAEVDFTKLRKPRATLTILYDGDELPEPDEGIRNPDNLVWSEDGFIYVQEDASRSAFGTVSDIEASVWALDPVFRTATRIAEMNRSAVPSGQTDDDAGEFGNWESSGVLDVTRLFETVPGERLLMLDVQAHGIDLDSADLDQGGQLLLLSIGAP